MNRSQQTGFGRRLGALSVLCASLMTLAGCEDGSGDPNTQLGANPKLPSIQQYLFPPMHLARVVGWKNGETPNVAPGLKIKALATGLQHPRSLYVLPNGDILVVESKSPGLQPVRLPLLVAERRPARLPRRDRRYWPNPSHARPEGRGDPPLRGGFTDGWRQRHQDER